MTTPPSHTGDLTLNHILAAAGLGLNEVIVLRHTYTSDGLASPADLTEPKILDYVRTQGIRNKLGKTPPFIWVNFMADGKRRCRFLCAYENHGEVESERSDTQRFFDLRPSDALMSLKHRLVIEWSRDPVNWAKRADRSDFPVVEIADPQLRTFPGFDRVLISHSELQDVVDEPRYAHWRTALSSVQGIYLIADTSSGKLYVGKADGSERILGRWTAYAKTGHGGNVALRELDALDLSHRQHFMYSLLRVFGPSVPTAEIDDAENHFKRALLTRHHGLNRN